MKKIAMIVMIAVFALLGTGCVTDKPYAVGKALYPVGKAVVEANTDKLSDGTLETLKTVDEAASTYDETRTQVRKVLDTPKEE